MYNINNTKWNLELLRNVALKYNKRSAFKKYNKGAYEISRLLGILDEVCSHMSKRVDQSGKNSARFIWHEEAIRKAVSKCKTKAEFKKRFPGAYVAAKKIGILEELIKNKPNKKRVGKNNSNYRWTLKALKKEGLKYMFRSDFENNSPGAYSACLRRGILDEVCAHMNITKRTWAAEEIWEKAKECSTRAEFRDRFPAACTAAYRAGIIDIVLSHTKKSITTSYAEIQILEHVKIYFEKAKKFYARKIKIEGKPHIKGFDVDILVTELNKGIEFDGKYYHSFEGLKRSKPHWPDEDIHNYHQIKDDYFKSKGIEILHISEKEWLANKEECFQRINQFLGI